MKEVPIRQEMPQTDPSVAKDTMDEESGTVVSEILELLGRVVHKLSPDNAEARAWITRNSRDRRAALLLLELTATSIRVLDAIGRLGPANGITVSIGSGVPRGTVSKVARRLIAQNLATKESLPDNKKEVLYRLTATGKRLFHLNQEFDEHMKRGFVEFLRRYDVADLRFVVRLLRDTADVSFLEIGSRGNSR